MRTHSMSHKVVDQNQSVAARLVVERFPIERMGYEVKEAMRTLLIGVVAGAVVVGTLAAQTKPARPQAPTATEVFHLRTECAELGEKLLLKLYDSLHYDQESHYDASANRCYVAIRFWKGTLREGVLADPKLAETFLYDGQTERLLAYYKLEGDGCPTGIACQKTGQVFVDSARSKDADEANRFITITMADDPK